MSCIHITGTRRSVIGCPPFKFTGRGLSAQREAGIRANAKHSNPNIRAAAASSYAAPADILLELAGDTDEEVRCWVARNEQASGEALEILASDPAERVRAYVAWNPHTPFHIIKLLVEDESLVVRELARQNVESFVD